jgi:hypothetical protein
MEKSLKKLNQLVENLKNENKIMHKISTSFGFYSFYFENLKNYKTENECFNEVNELYFNLFGVYKYENYQTFKSTIFN